MKIPFFFDREVERSRLSCRAHVNGAYSLRYVENLCYHQATRSTIIRLQIQHPTVPAIIQVAGNDLAVCILRASFVHVGLWRGYTDGKQSCIFTRLPV